MRGKRILGERRSASTGRRRWLFFLAVLLGLVLAVPVAFGAEDNGPETPAAESAPAPTPAELAPIEKEEREYAEWLESPAAENQRENSETAYTALSSGEARSLLSETFAEELEGLNGDPGRILSTLEVEKPLGTYSALVKAPDGNSAILNSSVPLQSDIGGEGNQQVNLTLEPSGQGFVPANPFEEVELPGSAAESIHLEGGIGIKLPAGADPAAERLGSMNLFYPETQTDTDTLVAPRANGVEVFEQLRSPQSPEELRFDLSLPEGAKLRSSAHGGGAEVVSEAGDELMEVTPPTAADAQGVPVPVTMSVEGDSLVLEVPNQSGEFAYPILVDPNYVNNTTNFSEWLLGPGNYSGYHMQSIPGSLDAFSYANTWYPEWSSANWVYGAVNQTTYIAAATFSPIDFLADGCYGENPHGYVGIFNTFTQSFEGHFGNYWGGNISNATWESGWVGGYNTRQAMIGIGTYGGVSIPCNHELFVGGYSIQEEDPYAPSFSSISGIPAAGSWFDPGAAGNASITAADNGLGVQEITISDGGGTTTHGLGCSGASGSRCPTSNSWTVAPPYVEGEKTLVISSHDPVGNSASWTRTTKADGTAPSASVTTSQTATTLNAKVETTDGVSGNARSGVKEVKVYLDKTLKETRTNTCSTSGCPFTLNFTYSQALKGLAAGSHTVEAIAFDQLNHQHTSTATFNLEPPDTIIDSGPGGLTNLRTPKFTYHSTKEGSTFACSVDGGAYVSCSATGYTTPELADGSHTFSVKATDGAGLVDATPASRTFTVDATPPNTTITSGPPAATSDSQPSFSYTSNEERVRFECGIDGAYANCPDGGYEVPSPLADGAHVFQARAVDAAGNVDPTPAVREFTVDSTPPTVQIESGPSGATNSVKPTFTFSTSGATTVQCSLETQAAAGEGVEWGACTTSTSYTPLLPLLDGSYVFRVRVGDAAGNNAVAERDFIVDTVAPDTTILSGPSGPTDDPKPTFTFTSNESGASFKCRFDSQPFEPCSGPGASHSPATALVDGSHVFEVRATDAAGNTDLTPASRSFSVVTNGPQTTIDSGPSGAIATNSATFKYSADEPSTFQCRLDGAPFASCPSGEDTLTGLSEGEHTFEVRAVNSSKVADPTPASRSFVVDTSAPPAVTVTGAVREPGVPGLTLHLEAQDGESSSASTRRSGISAIKIYIDNELVETWEAECQERLCPATEIRNVQLPWQKVVGEHAFTAYAEDGVEHVSPPVAWSKTTSKTPTMTERASTAAGSSTCKANELTEAEQKKQLNRSGFTRHDGVLEGTPESDLIISSGHIKTIKGLGGCDVIVGGPQKETIKGGPGEDIIRGGRSDDKLYGEGGNDQLYGGIGDDTIHGGANDDILDGGPGAEHLFGGTGNDTIRGGQGEDALNGGAGTDAFSYADALPPGFAENESGYNEARSQGIENFPLPNESGVYAKLNQEHPVIIAGPTGLGGGNDRLIGKNQGEFEIFVGSPFSDWIRGGAIKKLYPGPGSDVITEKGTAEDLEAKNDNVEKSSPSIAARDGERIEIGSKRYPETLESDVYALGSKHQDVFEVRAKRGSVAFKVKNAAHPEESDLKNFIDTPGCKAMKSRTVTCNITKPLGALAVEGGAENDTIKMRAEEPKEPGGIELDGGRDSDTLSGLAAEELLVDGPGGNGGENEVLRGGAGDDALFQGLGPDRVMGNAGNDLVISSNICEGDSLYGDSPKTDESKGGSDNAQFHPLHGTGIFANLKTGKVGETVAENGCPGGQPQEELNNFEDIEATKQPDQLYGDKWDNLIIGRAGHDEMFGLGGRDTINAKDGKKNGPDTNINCDGGKEEIAHVDSNEEKKKAKEEGCENPDFNGHKHEDEAHSSALLLDESEGTEPPVLGQLDGERQPPGALAYYPFDDSSGTSAESGLEEQPPATYEAAGVGPSVNGPGPTIGVAGAWAEDGSEYTAVRLDGVDDYVDLGGEGAPTESAAGYTVAMFVKFTHATATEREFLFSAAPPGASTGLYLFREPNGKIVFATGLGAGAPRILSPETVNDEKWHQVMAAIEGETMRLNIDGYPQQLGFGAPLAIPTPQSPTAYVGAGPGPAHFLAATVDEFATFAGPFAESEVLENLAESAVQDPAIYVTAPAETADYDGDGVTDGVDNCPTVSNPDQADTDMNGIGDACEPLDSDGDEVPDASDNCPLDYNPDQADSDGDGYGDVCDEREPVAITGGASELTGTTAKVEGSVNPEGEATTYQFAYGTTEEYGQTAPATAKEVGSGSTAVAVSESLSGLSPGTTYHYRLVAVNAAGVDEGEDATFSTPKLPTATTKPALAIRASSASLNGSVNPQASATTYQFEYGKTTAYGSKVPASPPSAGSGTTAATVSATASGLEVGTTYHYRVVATSVGGTAFGADATFTTAAGTFSGSQLSAMPVTEPFNGTTTSTSEFASKWTALGWAAEKGIDTTAGWRPNAAFPTVNGAAYNQTLNDSGPGLATAATLAAGPANLERYFSLWVDMPNSSAASRSGYELRFTDIATDTYQVSLYRWVSGTPITLASQASYAFPAGSSLALLDRGGKVTAWTNTGSGFAQLLSAADSEFSGGRGGIEGAGNITKLTNFKFGAPTAPMTMDTALAELPVRDRFAPAERPLSEGGAWTPLQWDTGTTTTNTGQVSSGWGPIDAFSTVNGAFWHESFSDSGSGDAVSATLSTGPAVTERYFSLWLDSPSPSSLKSGYELRFLEATSGSYTATISRWVAGTKTVLATKTGYVLSAGSQFALAEKGGIVSAWTTTAPSGEFSQILAAFDSTFSAGYPAIEASGNNTRLINFAAGPLPAF